MEQGKGRINKTAGIMLLVVGMILIACGCAFAVRYVKNNPDDFYPDKRSLGKRLLKEIRAYDLVNDYPETAEDVCYLNNLIMQMYYGKIITGEEILKELVGIQRQLFSDFLIENNSFESQWQKISSDSKELYDNNIYVYNISSSIDYDNDNECIMRITETMINYEKLYWNYYLKRDDDGRWKINLWKRTDKTFRNEIEEGKE